MKMLLVIYSIMMINSKFRNHYYGQVTGYSLHFTKRFLNLCRKVKQKDTLKKKSVCEYANKQVIKF